MKYKKKTSLRCKFFSYDFLMTCHIFLKEQASNYYTILIDNQKTILKTNAVDSMYSLAENLTDTKHQIDIVRNTEWSTGNTVFKGFEINKTASLYPPIIQERKIEFIGKNGLDV